MTWQPIETAPRGYQAVLAWSAVFETAYRVFWEDDLGGFVQSMSDDDTVEYELGLTHWMPMPPPPSAA